MILTTAVLVMGAGIQGCCTALELARHGMSVTLLDQDRLPMNRASLRNEGKIHLGLVYANDPSMQTAELQLQGAMTFWPLISRWTGCKPDELAVCNPFYYLVAEDSLMNPAELEEHYERLQKRYDRLLSEDPELNYLGQRPECLFRRLNDRDIRSHFNEKQVIAAFSTEERSVSTEPLAECIRNAVDRSAKIDFLPGFHATSLSRRHGGFCVEGDGSAGHWCIHADQVVNATWDGRRKLDRQIGLESDGWLYRLKYRVIVKIPPELYESPSATMVLGRYGDVVIRPDHSAYLSWYPEAIRGWSHAMQPPDSWQDPCQGKCHAKTLYKLPMRCPTQLTNGIRALPVPNPFWSMRVLSLHLDNPILMTNPAVCTNAVR